MLSNCVACSELAASPRSSQGLPHLLSARCRSTCNKIAPSQIQPASPFAELEEEPRPAKRTGCVAWASPTFLYLPCRCILGPCLVLFALIACKFLLEMVDYASLRVFAYGWLTCITTGFGALPFVFVGVDNIGERPLAFANAIASGMMLSASCSMLFEAHEHSGAMGWQIFVGLLAGALFIRASERINGDGHDDEADDVAMLHSAFTEKKHFRKAVLIFTVMFCHSAAEGIAVGVSFSRQLSTQFGLYVSLLLAVHNIPEGLAVALVLVPRGVSPCLAAVIATLTSAPQPLLALVSYFFVDTFSWLLPLGLAFAAGAMVYVCIHELLSEAAEHLGWSCALIATACSFVSMTVGILILHAATGM